jgi:uncharacterized spore protein YtfJ
MSTSSQNTGITALTERGNFITQLADAIGSRANVATVFGEPIHRENTTVVPIARARWGLGGGGGQSAGQESNSQHGFGGGGGMVVQPVGYLVIRGDHVEYHEIHSTQRILGAIAAGLLIAMLLRMLGRR